MRAVFNNHLQRWNLIVTVRPLQKNIGFNSIAILYLYDDITLYKTKMSHATKTFYKLS